MLPTPPARTMAEWTRSSVDGGLPALKASVDSTLTDDLVLSAMVLARGVGGAVGWKAKALGWNQELWRERRQQG